MTNINFPSSGGSSVLDYTISECSGDAIITFVPSDNWYTVQHNSAAKTVLITAQSTSDEMYRTSDIIVNMNSSSCTTITVGQDGLTPCNCNALTNIDISLYEIPASGESSGTVVGTYTLVGGNCSDANISFVSTVDTGGQYYGGAFDLVAENGEIILVSDVIDNPYEDMIEFYVDVYYGEKQCSSFSIVQDGTEVTCDCTHKELLLKKAHQYFSNQPYATTSSTTKKYTPLTNVLIASGSTVCGTFYVADDYSVEGISSAWTETDDSHVYVYANIEPNNSGLGRSMPVNIYYTPKKENDDSNSGSCEESFAITLYQTENYFNCRTYVNSGLCNRFTYNRYGNSGYNSKNQYVVMHNYEWTSSTSSVITLETDYTGKKLRIKPTFEVGYCDVTINKSYGNTWETENEEPLTNIDPSDIAELSYSGNTTGSARIGCQFKDINSADTKFKYAKAYLDLYTDDGNVYCCTPATYYWIQGPYECCDCARIPSKANLTTIPSEGKTDTLNGLGFVFTGQSASVPCAYGVYIDSVRVDPSSAGTILSVSYDTDNGGISAYTYQIYENNDAERNVNIIQVLKCSGDTEGCDYIRAKYKQPKNACDCTSLLSTISHRGTVAPSEPNICSTYSNLYEKTRSYFPSSQTPTEYFDVYVVPYLNSTNTCQGAEAYMVICDANRTPITIPSSRRIMGECTNNMNSFGFYDSIGSYSAGRGFKLKTYNYGSLNFSMVLENPNPVLSDGCYNVYECYPSFYYYIDIYKNDEKICTSSRTYLYNNGAKFVVKAPKEDCKCEPSCNILSDFTYEINTALTICMKDSKEHILVSSGGGEFITATFNHYNGEDLTNFGICSGIGTFIYSVSSTTSDVSCDIVNGNQLRVNVGEFTSETQRLFTCDIHYGYADAFGGTTYCVDRYLTIYFLQCGNEYENCSCSNES